MEEATQTIQLSLHLINQKRINKFIFFNWFHEIHLLNWVDWLKKYYNSIYLVDCNKNIEK